MPPSQRCSYECTKTPTGPLNRKKLIEHINKQAMETPDIPDMKPYVPGTVRGKKVSQSTCFYENIIFENLYYHDYFIKLKKDFLFISLNKL